MEELVQNSRLQQQKIDELTDLIKTHVIKRS